MGEEAVRVEAYAGGRGDESPRAFWLGDERVEVAGVLRSWIGEDEAGRGRRRFFQVRTAGGDECLLSRDERLGVWFIRTPFPG